MSISTARESLEKFADVDVAAPPRLVPAAHPSAVDGGHWAMWSKLLAAFPRTAATSHAAADSVRHAAPAPASVFLPRCIVLQSIGAAFVVGLWIAGLASKPFEGDNAYLCGLIAAIGAVGLVCVFLQRWRDVQWIATHVVRIGLLGTVVGLIMAFSAAAAGDSSDPSAIKPMIAAVVSGMYVSLFATLLGIVTNLWLKINLRVLGHDHG